MKICIMGKWLYEVSGHAKPAFSLARELAYRGNEVVILRGHSRPMLKDKPEHCWDDEPFRMITACDSLLSGLYRKTVGITDTIQSALQGVDIVHLFEYIPPGLIRSCAGVSFPIIYTLNHPYRLKISELVQAGPTSFLAAASLIRTQSLYPSVPAFVYRKVLNGFDRIVTTSKYVGDDVISIGIPRQKVDIMPAWIDMPSIKEAAFTRRPGHTFAYFGWASSIRGLPDVVKAFEIVHRSDPSATLILGAWSNSLEAKMHRYLISKSKIADSIKILKEYRLDILEVIGSVDAVVLPFRSACVYAQPPLVVLEAMALGRCVISTRVGSVPEIISDGDTGFLVSPRDCEAMAEKMLLTYNDKLKREIGDRAQQYIIKMHNVANAADTMLKVYADAIRDLRG
jgi:glycosyltransferase involved in cell wall biosynthesis